ncbi:MAG: LysR family transcriptional regulator [Alphaproteobacteria bacterium]|nr:LysR family transcriptional regulator [Alphaproteobacteria bacterium]
MQVSLDALETLDAVVREGSFAGAAQALHKAQSAVSYAVRQLEERLGVVLFDRSGHRAVLTPAGAAVLDEGRFLLSRARRLEWLAGRFAGGWEPRLEVVIDGVLPIAPIVEALRTLGTDEVPTHIQVRQEFLGGVQRRFELDGADLMLVKDYRPAAWLVADALPEHELVLVAAADHPVHATDEPHDLLSLQRFLELSVHDSSDETLGVDTHDVGGARVFYLADFHGKREALRLGLGFGWMPAPLVADDLATGRLLEVRSRAGSRRRFQPFLVHRVDRPLGRAGTALREGILDAWPRG